MKITVTRDDIDGGRRRDPNNCAVALALRRSGITHFGVTGMLVCLGPGHTNVLLPGPVQEWIVDFDWGVPVNPIEFELALPELEPAVSVTRPAPEPEPAVLECANRKRLPLSAYVRRFMPSVPMGFDRGGRPNKPGKMGRRNSESVVLTK